MMGLGESNTVNRGDITVVPLRQHCCEEWHGEILGWRYDGSKRGGFGLPRSRNKQVGPGTADGIHIRAHHQMEEYFLSRVKLGNAITDI